jgi:hypothetical protein
MLAKGERTKNSFIKLAAFLWPALFPLGGCHISQTTLNTTTTCTVDGPNQGVCTVAVGGSITIAPNATGLIAEPNDLFTIQDGSYVLSLSAPSSVFSSNTDGSPTTTLSVTTDTGYSSSITLPLNPVAPAVSPVNAGDAVFSFGLPDTTTFDNWMQNVAVHTVSTMTLSISGALPLQANNTSGSVTISTVLTSNSTGSVDFSDLTFFRTVTGVKCGPDSTNPGCPVSQYPAQ